PRRDQPPAFADAPLVSILVPCHNEADNIEETIAALLAQRYPRFEIVAINDGSQDDTGALLDALAARHPQVRAIHLDRNLGKANALRMGTLAARAEYLVCIDGDALLDEYACHWLVWHLCSGPRVGAVTGNPRIRNRSTLLGKLQVGEFSSIIGMIKRAQRGYGRLFTISGVVSAFRKTALHHVGYWADDMVTEDIDISWRLQMEHWDIRYEPNALAWILMPETLRGLWRQRLRWARGGAEVLLRHGAGLFTWRRRRMWGVLAEYLLSVLWAMTMLWIIVAWVVGMFTPMPPHWELGGLMPGWHGVVLGRWRRWGVRAHSSARSEPWRRWEAVWAWVGRFGATAVVGGAFRLRPECGLEVRRSYSYMRRWILHAPAGRVNARDTKFG